MPIRARPGLTRSMDSASFQFVFFGLLAVVVSNLSLRRAWRSAVLLISSLVFLALLAHGVGVLVPLACFLLLGYVSILLVQRGIPTAQVLSIAVIVLVFAWLKKYTFLPEGTFLRFSYLTLGLSYIFFRVLHLVIEAKQVTPLAYLEYTLNFTTLVSGPIQRFDEFARDQYADEPLPLDAATIARQIERILLGLFKVNVLALLCSMVQQDALLELGEAVPVGMKLAPAFRLAAIYPFFLYANFSGYIDIVIALARLMRLRLPENFDRPFSSTSFLDFWNRWHITLSTWLKTYVYNPLFLNLVRRFPSPTISPYLGVFSFFVTFFLIGIWHGRTSEFALFGVLQGGGVAINKLWQILMARWMGRKPYKALQANAMYMAFARGLTFTWFAFTLFWFWGSWSQIGAAYHAIGGAAWIGVWAAVWLVATAVLAAWETLRVRLLAITIRRTPVLTSRYAHVVYATAFAVAAFVFMALLSQPAPDIVYKAF